MKIEGKRKTQALPDDSRSLAVAVPCFALTFVMRLRS